MTKTRVNLYAKALEPVSLVLSFQRFSMAVIGTLLLAVLLATWGSWRLSQMEQEHRSADSRLQQLKGQKLALEEQLAKRLPDSALLRDVERTEQELTIKQRLLGELGLREGLSSQGFSALMTDLASVANNNIWLKRIRVEDQKFIFEGVTKHPVDVPRWVERLQSTDTLKGHAFASMVMGQGEGKPLGFTLTSLPKESTP